MSEQTEKEVPEQEADATTDAQTVEKAAKHTKKNEKKAGVVYLSRIPTKMNVKILRDHLGRCKFF
jgi:hypothetical protein